MGAKFVGSPWKRRKQMAQLDSALTPRRGRGLCFVSGLPPPPPSRVRGTTQRRLSRFPCAVPRSRRTADFRPPLPPNPASIRAWRSPASTDPQHAHLPPPSRSRADSSPCIFPPSPNPILSRKIPAIPSQRPSRPGGSPSSPLPPRSETSGHDVTSQLPSPPPSHPTSTPCARATCAAAINTEHLDKNKTPPLSRTLSRTTSRPRATPAEPPPPPSPPPCRNNRPARELLQGEQRGARAA